MEKIDVSDGTPQKNSESGYSNSCSNSQSRRSDSFASRHCGSNSSGSSGYGGKNSSSLTNSNDDAPQLKHKELKKKKVKPPASSASSGVTMSSSDRGISRGSSQDDPSTEGDASASLSSPPSIPMETQNINDDFTKDSMMPASIHILHETKSSMVINDDSKKAAGNMLPSLNLVEDDINVHGRRLSDDSACCSPSNEGLSDIFFLSKEKATVTNTKQLPITVGFTCVVSMRNGVVLYTNSSVSTALGYPKDMWLGRSFIDFLHPKDRIAFESHITSGVALPLSQPSANMNKEAQSSLFCRVRRYHNLRHGVGISGYGVKEKEVCYTPYRLEFTFKDVKEFQNNGMCLVISAIPVTSPYSDTNKSLVRFTTRHTSTGIISYVSNEAVGFLGYLPQDIIGRSIFDFYHPEDMMYLKEIYDTITKKENTQKNKSYRFSAHNGDYLTIETDWSSFINPWTKKLEFVIGHHLILEGPNNIEVFQNPKFDIKKEFSDDILKQSRMVQEDIMKSLNEVMTKCTEVDKQLVSKKCKELASFMEAFADGGLRLEDQLRIDIPDRDSVILGEISPHHEYDDSKSSTETPPSYNQLNYSENLNRFFESHPWSTRRSLTPEAELWTENEFSASDIYLHGNHRKCFSPNRHDIGDSGGGGSSAEFRSKLCHSTPLSHPRREMPVNKQNASLNYKESTYKPAHLTPDLLNKHKNYMEKMLIKKHKDARSISRAEEREKIEKREKKIESHFDNLPYTSAQFEAQIRLNEHGFKRTGSMTFQQDKSQKVCKNHADQNPSFQYQKPLIHMSFGASIAPPMTTTKDNSLADIFKSNIINTPKPAERPYVPVSMDHANNNINNQGTASTSQTVSNTFNNGLFPAVYLLPQRQGMGSVQAPGIRQVPYVMYPTRYQPIMYSHVPMAPVPMTLTSNHLTLPTDIVTPTTPLCLPMDNYIQCHSFITPKPMASAATRVSETVVISGYPPVRIQPSHTFSMKKNMEEIASGSGNAINNHRNISQQSGIVDHQMDTMEKNPSSDEVDDSQSSNSSFYSSFLKTETSNSAEFGDSSSEVPRKNKSINVCVTSELIYKYQLSTKNLDEVLKSDQNCLDIIEQPSLVNEQLSQLYFDLQMEGLSGDLKLEEGVSSSSSDEDSTNNKWQKGEYSKLVMVYEEDAPMPSPDTD